MISPAPGDSILFILLRAMGDVLLATPAIRAFKNAFPDVALDVLAEQVPSQPLRNNPCIRNLIVAPNRGASLDDYAPLVAKLRRADYKAVADFHSTPGSALLARITRAPFRIGFDRRFRGWAFTHLVEPSEGVNYASIPKFRLLEPFGISLVPEDDSAGLVPELFPSDSDEQIATDRLLELKIPANANLIGLAPYCKRDWRMWPLENWKKLLTQPHWQTPPSASLNPTFLLFAGPDEREYLSELEEVEGVKVIWAGMSQLLETAALMRKCRAIVGGENGLLHLAVAAGVPTFTIFCGRDEPARWVPPNDPGHVAIDLRDGSEMNVGLALSNWLANR